MNKCLSCRCDISSYMMRCYSCREAAALKARRNAARIRSTDVLGYFVTPPSFFVDSSDSQRL
jgi:hypothetical protein